MPGNKCCQARVSRCRLLAQREQNFAGARGTDIGNVPRNCIVGPSQSTLDFALTKTFHLREERAVEFRTEFFNHFNHANLANPISNLNAVTPSGGSIDSNTGRVLQPGSFGRIISTSASPRLIQFAVRAMRRGTHAIQESFQSIAAQNESEIFFAFRSQVQEPLLH